MRAALLLFLAAAFDVTENFESPTEDPEEAEIALLDEYSSDGDFAARVLQVANTSNPNATQPAPPVVEPQYDTKIPVVPLAIAGAIALGAAAFFMCKPAHTYETYDYDHAAESGLLEDPDYEVHEEYDSEYEEEEE